VWSKTTASAASPRSTSSQASRVPVADVSGACAAAAAVVVVVVVVRTQILPRLRNGWS